MGIFSQNDKRQLAFTGIEAGLSLFNNFREDSKKQREKEIEDGKIELSEYHRVVSELEEFQTYFYNVISDTELDCKFKKTEDIFIIIIKIIMFDLEYDYKEIFLNLNRFIDNEDFIEGHEQALLLRQKRLEKEYQEELVNYELQLKEYQIQLTHHNSKSFFKKLISSDVINPPIRPIKRQ